jgi:hypothetical protein
MAPSSSVPRVEPRFVGTRRDAQGAPEEFSADRDHAMCTFKTVPFQ